MNQASQIENLGPLMEGNNDVRSKRNKSWPFLPSYQVLCNSVVWINE